MNQSLYKINEEISAVMQGLINEHGEINELAEDQLDGLNQDKLAKVKNIGLFIKESQAFIDRCKEEEKRVAARRHSAEKRINWLKTEYLPDHIGDTKIDDPQVSIKIRESKSVFIGPFADLGKIRAADNDLVKQEIKLKPDKRAIKEYIERTGMDFEDVRIITNKSVTVR